ncbi:MAG: TolC family protein [Gammaproteobacteria bacterium]|nr:TolC family protein [Gammaproteobacteria bacterium]
MNTAGQTTLITSIPRLFAATVAMVAVGGCASSGISPATTELAAPGAWERGGDADQVGNNWLATFGSDSLTLLVDEAQRSNFRLAQERARLEQVQQSVIITRADRFPSIDLSLDGSRRAVEGTDGIRVASNSFAAGLDAAWEMDVWGRLSKSQQAAQLSYSAQKARFEFATRDLAARTAGAMFDALEARALLELAEKRLDNARQSRDIVASGYRQGLNDALDLYLANNQVEQEEAALAAQSQVVFESFAELQLAMGRYPSGEMPLPGELPVITDAIPVGLPSELLMRRPDIREAWLNLLSADAGLAAAHKNRFPRITLVGSAGVTSVVFSDLLDGDGAGWSLIGGITQPIFQAGRLGALEEQAAARVREAEQIYLDVVFQAFAEVENAISRNVSLTDSYSSFVEAEKNAMSALRLATEQYQRGLVSYTTVLESRRRAFDASTTVIQLRNDLLQNRIALHLALGGEFSTDY